MVHVGNGEAEANIGCQTLEQEEKRRGIDAPGDPDEDRVAAIDQPFLLDDAPYGLFEVHELLYEQEEQLDEEQPEQPGPLPLEDDLKLWPTEKPKEDIFFPGCLSPHFGHSTGSSVLKTMHSKSSPQFWQLYS